VRRCIISKYGFCFKIVISTKRSSYSSAREQNCESVDLHLRIPTTTNLAIPTPSFYRRLTNTANSTDSNLIRTPSFTHRSSRPSLSSTLSPVCHHVTCLLCRRCTFCTRRTSRAGNRGCDRASGNARGGESRGV